MSAILLEMLKSIFHLEMEFNLHLPTLMRIIAQGYELNHYKTLEVARKFQTSDKLSLHKSSIFQFLHY